MGQYIIPKTVFVLGAGASHGLGFPLGNGLKRELLSHLKPGNTVFEAVAASGFPKEKVQQFAKRLARAEFDTLDDHLREIADPDSRNIGHLAVAYVIRILENDDRLFHTDDQIKHWYKAFANHLRKHKEHASPAHFSFITYNYDRSLPHYLFETLEARNVPAAKLEAFLGETNVHHVHGSVGALPWQLEAGDRVLPYHQYGASINVTDLAAQRPRILHPDDAHQNGLMPARLAGGAEVVAFVGFGFHPSNMRQLPFEVNSQERPVLRRYFSINPTPPPPKLTIDGQVVAHINGNAEDAMSLFFTELESGYLFRRADEAQNASVGRVGRRVIKVIR